MKNTALTAASILLLFIPWSILPLRSCSWALESPAAETIIAAYAALMIAGCLYTTLCYIKLRMQSLPMKACLLMHGLYALAALAIFGQLLLPG